jgi:hemerythrin-like domain-containing protein
MATPLDAITVIHRAFRLDMYAIDNAAYKAATGEGNLSTAMDRLRFFSEILLWHAEAEEEAVFPGMDRVAPLVTRAYSIDHRELDTMTEDLAKMSVASDTLIAARATAALTAHLKIHLDKEDAHLYPILRERILADEQASIVGTMAQKIPPDRMPEVVRWMFPLLGHDDRETMTRVWMALMPEQVFAAIKGLIRDAVAEDWAELVHRIPELN